MNSLIERMRARAHRPETATDQGYGRHKTVVDGQLVPVRFVANAPASSEMIAAAEQILGRSLPDLLKRLYLEIGNGGFGPGYGLLPLPVSSEEEDTVLSLYEGLQSLSEEEDEVDVVAGEEEWRPGPWFPPPDNLIPLCDWGCAIYSLLDCSREPYAIVRLDTTRRTGKAKTVETFFEEVLTPERASLVEWLEAWLDGERLFTAVFNDD